MFLKLDTSKDGLLSIEEIKNGIGQVMGPVKSQKEYMDMMKSLDRDGNGVIDYTEFITAAIDKVAFLSGENLRAAFQILDKDGGGTITIDELKEAFDAHNDKDEELWKEIMAEVDENNDNEISFEEFV